MTNLIIKWINRQRRRRYQCTAVEYQGSGIWVCCVKANYHNGPCRSSSGQVIHGTKVPYRHWIVGNVNKYKTSKAAY